MDIIKRIDRLVSGEVKLETIEDVDRYVVEFAEHLASISWTPTIEERRAYDEHLVKIRRQRQARIDRLQARRNATEVTKIRQAACPRCFSTHNGEC